MNVSQVANKLHSYLKNGKFEEAQRDLFHEHATSLEPEKSNIPVATGKEGIIQKGEHFRNSVAAWHNFIVGSPAISKDYFAIPLKIDVTYKGQETATSLDEIILYQVEDGKIILEQFFY